MSSINKEIFIREEALIGKEGLNKLKKAKVAVCGLGGVGSYLAEALARSAVGRLLLIDFDQVVVSNINRQICAFHSTLGQDKVDLMSARIADINPKCKVEVQKIFLDENSDLINIFKGVDYIGDAIDYMSGKTAMIEYANLYKIPLISAMGAGQRLDPSKLAITDISKTHTCPVAKSVRKRLRQLGINKGVKVVFSTETPLPSVDENIGSIVFVPAISGLLMAGEIVKDILEK